MNELSDKAKLRLKHVLAVIVVLMLIVVLSFVYRYNVNQKKLEELRLREALIESMTAVNNETVVEDKKETVAETEEYQESMGMLFDIIGEQYSDNEDVQKIVSDAKVALAVNPKKIGSSLESKSYVRTIELAWNELTDLLGVETIELEEQNAYVDYLNKKVFTKDDLDKDSYYVVSGVASQDLRNTIEKTLKDKFKKESNILDEIQFDGESNHYIIYSTLNKKFTFINPFTESRSKFKDSEQEFKFSKLACYSVGDKVFEQVEALFYNNENDFAIKINTLEGDEVILYRNDEIKDFSDAYYAMENKTKKFTGKTTIEKEKDEILFPFINYNVSRKVEEISDKKVKDMNVYIKETVEDITFNLDNFGGNLSTDAYVDIYMSASMEEPRYFHFTDDFMIFLKEKDSNMPYFYLYVDDTQMLELAEITLE